MLRVSLDSIRAAIDRQDVTLDGLLAITGNTNSNLNVLLAGLEGTPTEEEWDQLIEAWGMAQVQALENQQTAAETGQLLVELALWLDDNLQVEQVTPTPEPTVVPTVAATAVQPVHIDVCNQCTVAQ